MIAANHQESKRLEASPATALNANSRTTVFPSGNLFKSKTVPAAQMLKQ
jgi:hypothetical protein